MHEGHTRHCADSKVPQPLRLMSGQNQRTAHFHNQYHMASVSACGPLATALYCALLDCAILYVYVDVQVFLSLLFMYGTHVFL